MDSDTRTSPAQRRYVVTALCAVAVAAVIAAAISPEVGGALAVGAAVIGAGAALVAIVRS